MTKPKMKREIAIRAVIRDARHIMFDATPDAASDLEEFGKVKQLDSMYKNSYDLFVDARYDLDEVTAYIQSYGLTTSA